MEGEDEIIFSGAYKDFKLGVRFPMGNATVTDAAYALGYISARIEESAFRYAGINIAKIKEFAKPNGKGLLAVVSFLESNPQNKIKEALLVGLENKLLLPAAESYFFNILLKNAEVDFKITDKLTSSSISAEEEISEDQIAFIANFKSWVSIKKLGLDDAQDYEVSAVLSGIENTIIPKAFDFSGCKKNDDVIEKITFGRKSHGNLLAALKELLPNLTGNKLDDAYLIYKVFEKAGYKPFASPEMLTQAYPDVKPPKQSGRRPKSGSNPKMVLR